MTIVQQITSFSHLIRLPFLLPLLQSLSCFLYIPTAEPVRNHITVGQVIGEREICTFCFLVNTMFNIIVLFSGCTRPLFIKLKVVIKFT